MTVKTWIGIILFGVTGTAFAQDPVFTHYQANTLLLNPAMAGAEGPSRLFTGYRNQWPGTGAVYETYQASWDRYMEPLHGGVGLRIMNDRQGGGIYSALTADAIYAYRFRVSRDLHLAGALQASFGQRMFRFGDDLVFGDMIDPVTGAVLPATETPGSYSRVYPDAAAGATFQYKKMYGGMAVHHLLEPRISPADGEQSRLPRRYTVHAGMQIPVTDMGTGWLILTMVPYLVYMHQDRVRQVQYAMDVHFTHFMAGFGMRHDLGLQYGNMAFSLGYVNDPFRFRYSYDVRLTRPSLNLPGLGAHELSLVFILGKSEARKPRRAINLPKI